MIRKTLPNSLRTVFQKTHDNTVTVEVTVSVGSNYEKQGIRGISHFLEHMLFEGTKKRPTSKQIAEEIENCGGEFNAATYNERTSFYIKIHKSHFRKAMDILADIIQNPLFEQKAIDKEKKVVINEIDTVNDEPRFFQWILFEKVLFKKNNVRYPIYGNKEDIKALTRKSIIDFYEAFYVPKNMVISIAGNIEKPFRLIRSKFVFNKHEKPSIPKFPPEKRTQPRTRSIKKPINQSYLVYGFDTCPIIKKDAIVLDIIRAHLARGFSGTLFEEIRNKRGLAYSLGCLNDSQIDFGYFAVYLSCNPKDLQKIIKIIKAEIAKISEMTHADLKNAKSFIEGDLALTFDDNSKLADYLSMLELASSAALFNQYIPTLKKIKLADIKRVKSKYLKNPVQAIINPK